MLCESPFYLHFGWERFLEAIVENPCFWGAQACIFSRFLGLFFQKKPRIDEKCKNVGEIQEMWEKGQIGVVFAGEDPRPIHPIPTFPSRGRSSKSLPVLVPKNFGKGRFKRVLIQKPPLRVETQNFVSLQKQFSTS